LELTQMLRRKSGWFAKGFSSSNLDTAACFP
jgi:hypothetical protein